MVERPKPGDESQQPSPFYVSVPAPGPEYNLSTPTVPIKRYARFALRQENLDPRFTRSILDFVDAAYWDENQVGDIEARRQYLIKRGRRQGLLPEEMDQVIQRAGAIYNQYKELAGLTVENVLTREAIIDFESSRMRPGPSKKDTGIARKEGYQRTFMVDVSAVIRKLREERKREFKKRLEQNFREVMKPTDSEIRILNANERLSFDEDPIYKEGSERIRQKFVNRSLSQKEYNEQGKKIIEQDPYEAVKHVLDLAGSKENIPTLIRMLWDRNSLIREAAAEVLDDMGWKPTNQREFVYYMIAKGRTDQLEDMGEEASIAILNTLPEDDEEDKPSEEVKEKNDDQDPLILQQAIEDSSPKAFWKAVAIFHPEWEESLPSLDKLIDLGRAIYCLPPVGGKIFAIKEDVFSPEGLLRPSMTVEEQVKAINTLRQRGQLGAGYIHQLTVQGRLPDKFKYVALALIVHSPYAHRWDIPFFEAPWGKVAPMVHDGGNTIESLNPVWRHTRGRTDFLQRAVPVYVQNLEELEKLSSQERARLPIDDMVRARAEQEERERLVLEATAYQRLALALHSSVGTLPRTIPEELKGKLAGHWDIFEKRMNLLLKEYDVESTVRVVWFNPTHRQLTGWPGVRHEATWEPIQQQLIKLEDTRLHHPELIDQTRAILRDTTYRIDEVLGLKKI